MHTHIMSIAETYNSTKSLIDTSCANWRRHALQMEGLYLQGNYFVFNLSPDRVGIAK